MASHTLVPVQDVSHQVTLYIPEEATVDPGIDVPHHLHTRLAVDPDLPPGAIAGASCRCHPARGVHEHAEIAGILTIPVIGPGSVSDQVHRTAGKDPTSKINLLSGYHVDLRVGSRPGHALRPDATPCHDGTEEVDVMRTRDIDITTGREGLDHRGGFHQNTAREVPDSQWILTIKVLGLPVPDHLDPVLYLYEGSRKLHPVIGLDAETTVLTPHEDTSLHQNVIRTGQGKQAVVGQRIKLPRQLNTGVHRVSFVVVLIYFPAELHDVPGADRPVNPQFMPTANNHVSSISSVSCLPDTPNPFNTGEQLAIDVNGLWRLDIDQGVAPMGRYRSGNLDQLEEGSGTNNDRGLLPIHEGLACHHHGITGLNINHSTWLIRPKHTLNPLLEIVQGPVFVRRADIAHHRRAVAHPGTLDIDVDIARRGGHHPINDHLVGHSSDVDGVTHTKETRIIHLYTAIPCLRS